MKFKTNLNLKITRENKNETEDLYPTVFTYLIKEL